MKHVCFRIRKGELRCRLEDRHCIRTTVGHRMLMVHKMLYPVDTRSIIIPLSIAYARRWKLFIHLMS